MTNDLMAPVGGAVNDLEFGSVYSRSLSIFSRNVVPFATLSAVAALPYLVFYLNNLENTKPGVAANPLQVLETVLLPLVIGFLLRMIAQAIILNGAFQYMRGREISVGESLRVGFSRFLPVVGLVMCEGIGLVFGYMLLIVPGVILQLAWFVALPACVVEGIGPIASLGRSAALTKGSRWKILAVAIVLGIIGSVIGAVVGAVGGAIGGKTGIAIAQYVVQLFLIGFQAILTVVIYHDLRVAKEGVDTETIASVFD